MPISILIWKIDFIVIYLHQKSIKTTKKVVLKLIHQLRLCKRKE